jgi:dienelactone hydrolase
MRSKSATEALPAWDKVRRTTVAAGLVFAAAPTLTFAQAPSTPASAPPLAADLGEEIIMVRKPGVFGPELETTLFRPPGEGPFPLILVNHGKASGNPRFQARSRYLVAARELVRRGYAVVVPMRQGFSKSGGSYIGGGCNVESNGRVQAEDLVVVLAFYAARPDIDARRTVVFGQSHGGLTTLALGALGLPNVVGLVNFAGGLRQEGCNGWERSLADAVASYARTTTAPSLWFYGDNDSYFTPETWQRMHAQYVAAGGRARLVAFGSFGTDAHELFSSARGAPVWLPEVGAFFTELGLPFALSKA